MYENFSVAFRPLTLDEVSDIISYDASDEIANITDEEFLRGLKSQHQSGPDDELTRGLLDQLLGIERPTNVRVPPKKTPVRRDLAFKKTNQKQTGRKLSSQILNRIPNRTPFRRPVLSQSNKLPPKAITKRPRVPLDQLKTIKPLKDDLLDLLPPEPEELGVEMDKLLLATPDNDDENSDSVSLMSSDESFYDFNEFVDDTLGHQLEKSDSRPGLKLDLELYAPPPRDAVKLLPTTPIFSCENPRCSYTTSNPTKIKLHGNAHLHSYHG